MEGSHPTGSRGHIMLVDDDPAIRDVFAEALEHLGFTVTTADDHDRAITLLTTQPPPNLLITDVDLGPGKSGLDLLEQTQSLLPTLPILLISGHHAPHTSPTPILPKPFRLPDLLAAINPLLAHTEGE